MNNPKISFIVPVYNAEKKVKKCLQSILSQTYKNLEVVCINDGSKDNSLNVLRKMQEQDSRIVILDQENQGIFYARKNGVLKATGDYIMFSDNDDSLPDKNSCKKLIQIFNDNNDIQIIQFAHNNIRGPLKKTISFRNEGKITEKDLKNVYYEDFLGAAQTNAVSVDLWDKIFEAELLKDSIEKLEFKSHIGEDLYLNLAVFDNPLFKNIYIINDVMYDYSVGIGFSSTWKEDTLQDYSVCKKYQNELCCKWHLEEKAKNYCNLESIYFLLNIVTDLFYVKKKSDEKIIDYLNEAENYECVKIAKDYFRSRPEEELFDELIFLVNASPEEYLDFVKRARKKPKGFIGKCFDFAFQKIGLKRN